VFQADAVFPWLSVRGNLEYGPRVRRELNDAAKKRVDRYLDMMTLTSFANEFPKVLSGGMRKRVDVARVYVSDPSVVLLDEPFGALDDFTKSSLQDELIKLKLIDPKTTVFVTHDIEEAIYVADIIAVMTTCPGQLQELITVPLPRDRDASVKDSGEFRELREHIQGLLRRTIAAAKGAVT
jgi:ABC-type nitrate/sulfonate/bicarbonate transport system ATPase subunit